MGAGRADFTKVVNALQELLTKLLTLREITDNFDYDIEAQGADSDGVTYTEKMTTLTQTALGEIYQSLWAAKEATVDFKSSDDMYMIFERTLDLVSAGCDPVVSLQELCSNLHETASYAAGQKQTFLLVHERLRNSGIDTSEYDKCREVMTLRAVPEEEEEEEEGGEGEAEGGNNTGTVNGQMGEEGGAKIN